MSSAAMGREGPALRDFVSHSTRFPEDTVLSIPEHVRGRILDDVQDRRTAEMLAAIAGRASEVAWCPTWRQMLPSRLPAGRAQTASPG